MIGNLLSSIKNFDNDNYQLTDNTITICAVMDILINKINFDSNNIIKTFQKWFNLFNKTFTKELINKEDLPYLLLDIGYFARDKREIEHLIKLFFREFDIEIIKNKDIFINTLILANLINTIHKNLDLTSLNFYFNDLGIYIPIEIKNYFSIIHTSKKYKECYDKVRDYSYYKKGITLSIAELYYKFIPNEVLLNFTTKLFNINKNVKKVVCEYLEDRELSLVNIEEIKDYSNFLIIENKQNNLKSKFDYLHSLDLRSLANYIIYQEMEVLSKFNLDDKLISLKELRDYKSFIKYTINSNFLNSNDKTLLNKIANKVDKFLNTIDINEFKSFINDLNSLNKTTYFRYILITNPYELIRYIHINDKDNMIFDKLLGC